MQNKTLDNLLNHLSRNISLKHKIIIRELQNIIMITKSPEICKNRILFSLL